MTPPNLLTNTFVNNLYKLSNKNLEPQKKRENSWEVYH